MPEYVLGKDAEFQEYISSDTAGARRIAISSSDSNFGNEVDVFRWFDDDWRFVGTLTSAGFVIYDAVYDISAAGKPSESELNLKGTYSYALTFYNSAQGVESPPIFTGEVLVKSGGVNLTNLEVSADPQVDKKRIYRLGGDLTKYTLVAEITNATTTYKDTVKDSALPGTLLQSADYVQAPAGLKYLTEAYAMLFGALGDKLYFTPIGKPYSWPSTYYLDMADTITGIGKTPIGLLVFTSTTTTLVIGTGPTLLSQQNLSEDQGCISHDSIVNVQGAALWASTDGVCMSEGGKVIVISKDRLGKINFSVVKGLIYDEAYHLVLANNKTFIWDFRHNALAKYEDYGIVSIAIANDKLYGFVNNKAYHLGAASENTSMHFKSGWMVSGSILTEKVHNRCFIFYKGDITFKLYVHEEEALSVSLSSAGYKLEIIDIPKEYTRNYFYELEVSGTGELYEVKLEEAVANA